MRKGALHSEFFVLRAPHLAFDELRRWADGVEAGAAAPDDPELASKVASDVVLLRGRLRGLVARPAVREAITVASASLARRLAKWDAEPEGKDGAKIEQAIVRYLGRMASRPTPFG